jgi:hypothetical protein
MRNPWDVPPFPKKGDHDVNSTFAGVGRVLTQWEIIEVKLSHTYGLLLNRPDDLDAARQYGEPLIFKERVKGLEKAAEAYFRWNPNQETETELCGLLSEARKFSARRNDTAHSIVRPFQWTDGPQQFGAFPPHYIGKKFDPNDVPAFAYTSVELIALSNDLFYFAEKIDSLNWKLMLGEDGVPPG